VFKLGIGNDLSISYKWYGFRVKRSNIKVKVNSNLQWVRTRDVPDSNFKIRPEPDSTGYQTNYPPGTGYLDTCCIIANFLVYFVVRIKMYYSLCLFSALCAHTLYRSTTNICKTVVHDSLVLTIWRPFAG